MALVPGECLNTWLRLFSEMLQLGKRWRSWRFSSVRAYHLSIKLHYGALLFL